MPGLPPPYFCPPPPPRKSETLRGPFLNFVTAFQFVRTKFLPTSNSLNSLSRYTALVACDVAQAAARGFGRHHQAKAVGGSLPKPRAACVARRCIVALLHCYTCPHSCRIYGRCSIGENTLVYICMHTHIYISRRGRLEDSALSALSAGINKCLSTSGVSQTCASKTV